MGHAVLDTIGRKLPREHSKSRPEYSHTVAIGGSWAGASGRPALSFGEIVFDRFEDSTHLGGAPLNFACYLRQFGVSVALVSAVGRDELGETALRSLAAAGVDTTWVESRPQPTGTVDVRLVDGEPEWTVAEGCAWEHIELAGGLIDARPTLVYCGTSAQKTATNRATLRALLSLEPRHVLLDINLRAGQYSPELVVNALNEATVLKMNEQEWQLVRKATSQNTLGGLLETSRLEMIALTRGGGGAELHVPNKKYVFEGREVRVVDTVGAGDAFSAALAAGVIRGADPCHALRVACESGAAAVQSRGALVELPEGLRTAFA